MNTPPIRIAIAGLGRAFTIMLPTFLQDERVRLVAAADPALHARTRFESDFAGATYDNVEALCASTDADVVYIATPHQFHAEHVCLAAAHGKHILVEKPMAITVDECTRMVDAVRAAGVQLVVGPSHSFDAPILRTRELIASGRYGSMRMIHAMNFTDFLYRPRRREELQTETGGGVVHSQAAHQIDIVRMLGGGMVNSVRAFTGAWDPQRPTEGAYSALIGFEGGGFCSATYSGFAHYDSDVLMEHISESGERKDPAQYGDARRRLATGLAIQSESAFKAQRNYGGAQYVPTSPSAHQAHQHFGHVVVCCDGADLRPTPYGVEVFDDRKRTFIPIPVPPIPRREVLDELHRVLREGAAPVHSAEWGRATTEVCLAILEAARTGGEVRLRYQVSVP